MAATFFATPLFLVTLILYLSFSHANALVNRQGRPGDLNDAQAQGIAQTEIEKRVRASIDPSYDYEPGSVSAMSIDLSAGIRLHGRFLLYDTLTCFRLGQQSAGVILGQDLLQAFIGNMLGIIQAQIRYGFGFGVVVESGEDANLHAQGLSAQFYYWVERIGQRNSGGDTPNTGEGGGPSDNNQHRHDELLFIMGGSQNKTRLFVNKTNDSKLLTNQVQPPHHVAHRNISQGTRTRKDDVQECLPYEYALFTSLYDINVLASASSDLSYPDLIYSPNELNYLIMQDDCNLVVYTVDSSSGRSFPIWACGDYCFNHGTKCFARLNLDGTFAVYNGNGTPLWYTPTQCSSGSGCWSDTYLAMQDDGNLVLYLLDTGVPVWASQTS